MATVASTLSGALVIYNNKYQKALKVNSKREIEQYQANINRINAYYDIVSISMGENEAERGQEALDAIVAILNAEGIVISGTISLPLGVGIYPSPAVITIPVDSVGINPDYDDAVSTVYIYQGGVDVSDTFTCTIDSVSDVTASIQNDNEVKIDTITADTGTVTIQAVKEGSATLTLTITVYKYYSPQSGASINVFPSNILIPSDYDGANPICTNAISTFSIIEGVSDETDNWTFTINEVSDVTAVIQNDNEVKIETIAEDEGAVTVKASRTGYEDQEIIVKVYKYPETQAGVSVNAFPSSIIIPAEGLLTTLTNAISTQTVREGKSDVTEDYTFSVQSQTNVTAEIQNSNEIKISAITEDQGNITVRASKTGYEDQDYEIPVQKLYKGAAVVDATSIDDISIGINDSDKLHLKRDEASVASIFGELPDMDSLYNEFDTGTTIDPSKYILKSTTLRKAPNSGLENIETPGSFSSFGSGNYMYGIGNFLDIVSLNGKTVTIDVYTESNGAVGHIAFTAASGDYTSYYTVGSKVLVYVDSVADTYYYICGTITASTFSTITEVYFDTDFTYTYGLYTNIYNAIIAGETVKAVVYETYINTSPNTGSIGNLIIGNDNLIKGESNNIHGDDNVLDNSDHNLIYGNDFQVAPVSTSWNGTTGNVLIGKGTSYNDAKNIKGHSNLVVSQGDGNIMSHEDNNGNILIGNSISIGEYNSSQTFGAIHSLGIGYRLQLPKSFCTAIGHGAKANTVGEIAISSSFDSVRKSIIILEAELATTTATIIKTLGRDISSWGYSSYGESIQVESSTGFTGTLDLTGYRADGSMVRYKYSCGWVATSAGVMTSLPLVAISEYEYIAGGFTASVAIITTTVNEAQVQITCSDAVSTKWNCIVEGVISDI